jgi:glycosyltransferase involved in cell wall biosynthesis
MERLNDLAVVVIARNEGERLKRCIRSCIDVAGSVIYADSDSSDGTPDWAREQGAEVVALDPSRPMNAPRGRNEGFERLLEVHPDARYVFFVDGDCEIVEGFLAAARDALESEPALGAVAGRRLETAPEDSVYNRVVDLEWNTPVGEARVLGGDAMVRVEAVRQVNGYNPAMACGEDPEFFFRLREQGWKLRRIDHDMTRHDVALLRFAPWWKRHARGGYAYTHGAALHFHGPEWFNVKAIVSILAWGLVLPVAAAVLAFFTNGLGLLLLTLYGLLWWRVRRWRIGLGAAPRVASVYAVFVAIGKVAETLGVLKCLAHLVLKRESLYVEYKDYQPTA